MTEKLNIVQSTTEPDKRNIWLKDNELKKFGTKGWSTIGGSNSGDGNGGTSTDKDALIIYIDPETEHIIINDKEFMPENTNTNTGVLRIIHDEELYNSLYNSLFNTNKIIYIKLGPNDVMYLFSEASYLLGEGEWIHIESYVPSMGNIFIRIYRT